jgi:hypothetical protein
MPKARRLADLYVVGQMIKIDDGQGDPVEVWLQKLNPIEQEKAMRQANAARSRFLSIRKNMDSDEYQSLNSQVYDVGDKQQLIEYLIAPEMGKLAVARESEISEEEEWSKDNYLQGLRDAWEGDDDTPGMYERYHTDPEDPEAKAVFEGLKKFTLQVEKSLEGEKKALIRDLEGRDIDKLREDVLVQLIDVQADIEWMKEFRQAEVYYAAREPSDHKRRYFNGREEVGELSMEVQTRLLEAYRSLSVDVIEGKDLQATDDSSPSPEQPSQVETVPSSGLQVVAQ